MKRQIAISDIHGCNQSFKALLDQVAFSKADELYLLGDYVDRGPDSKGVIDSIWQMQKEGYTVYCLMGNHEQMTIRDMWLERQVGFRHAGDEDLLESFKVKRITEIPEEYFLWMESLPLYLEIPGYILVHAGLNFEGTSPFLNEEALTWARNWYHQIDYEWLGERIIVHGHTPIGVRQIKHEWTLLQQQRVLNIDAGCSAMARPSAGLCAFDMRDQIVHFVECLDR